MAIEYITEKYDLEKLPLNTVVGNCPHCGRPMAIKNGKYGKYIHCKNIDCHTNINIKKYEITDQDCINLINLKRAEQNKDIIKANEIFENCSQEMKIEAKWSIDKIWNKLMEESYNKLKEDIDI